MNQQHNHQNRYRPDDTTRTISKNKPFVNKKHTKNILETYFALGYVSGEDRIKKYEDLVPVHGIKEKKTFYISNSRGLQRDHNLHPELEAAGPDNIFNFFINQLNTLHSTPYKLIKEIVENSASME
ncbi:hypothetical protein NGRA_2752 [Nosema granulosis]|uniref:Uncharacterized protein n=1 Tax=Nosema granulosis TaxID=83296 RepID=A0A9P6GW34_9MICR|nr:hypothetical protein NGRA_2752 [Nosema granulosis]